MRLVYISSAAVSFVGAPAADGEANIKHHFVADAKLTPVSLADVMAKEVNQAFRLNNSVEAAIKALERSKEILRGVHCFDDPECVVLRKKVRKIRRELDQMSENHNLDRKTIELLTNATMLAKIDERLHDKKFSINHSLADTQEEEEEEEEEKVNEDLYV